MKQIKTTKRVYLGLNLVLLLVLFSLSATALDQGTGIDAGAGTFSDPFVSNQVASGNIGVWENPTSVGVCRVAVKKNNQWRTVPALIQNDYVGDGSFSATSKNPFRSSQGSTRGLVCEGNQAKLAIFKNGVWTTALTTSPGTGGATSGSSPISRLGKGVGISDGAGTTASPYFSTLVDNGKIGIFQYEDSNKCYPAYLLSRGWSLVPGTFRGKVTGDGNLISDPIRQPGATVGLYCGGLQARVVRRGSDGIWRDVTPAPPPPPTVPQTPGPTTPGPTTPGPTTPPPPTPDPTSPDPTTPDPSLPTPQGSGCSDETQCKNIDKAFQRAIEKLSPLGDPHKQKIWDPKSNSYKQIWEVYQGEINPTQTTEKSQDIPTATKLTPYAQTDLQKALLEVWNIDNLRNRLIRHKSTYGVDPSYMVALIYHLNKGIEPTGGISACGNVGIMQLSAEEAIKLGLRIQFTPQRGEDISILNGDLNANPSAESLIINLRANNLLTTNPECRARPAGEVPPCNYPLDTVHCNRDFDERFDQVRSLEVTVRRLGELLRTNNLNYQTALGLYPQDLEPITYSSQERARFAAQVIAAQKAFMTMIEEAKKASEEEKLPGGVTPPTDSDKSRWRSQLPRTYARHQSVIDSAARDAGIPKSALVAVLHTESRGDPNAVSPSGAAGIMQFTPQTAITYGLKIQLKGVDPEVNRQLAAARTGTQYNAIIKSNGLWKECEADIGGEKVVFSPISPCNECLKATYCSDQDERFDTDKSIRAAARYLKVLYASNGNSWEKAFEQYHGGKDVARRTNYRLVVEQKRLIAEELNIK